jgi:hypothetical protein
MAATMAMVCALVWVAAPAHAQDRVVVIPLMGAPAAGPPAPVPKTGQTATYVAGDDGDLQKGVAWPNPRFTNNGNGTVTDHLTGLVWLYDGKCKTFYPGDPKGENYRTWLEAVDSANKLAAGYCGLTDDSKAGDWRLPNLFELHSLIDLGQVDPALPVGCPLRDSIASVAYYWSATTYAANTDLGWLVGTYTGIENYGSKSTAYWVRAVRGGN